MPPSSPDGGPGNIRVFVRWHEQTVFAGEEIKCTITFRNVAPTRDHQPRQSARQHHPNVDHPRLGAPLQARAKTGAQVVASATSSTSSSLTPPTSAASSRGHRSALSLSVPSPASRSQAGSSASGPWPPSTGTSTPQEARGGPHRRSMSIVSIGSSAGTAEDQPTRSNAAPGRSHRPPRGHARASSLQIVSRGAVAGKPGSNTASPRHVTSPLFNSSFQSDRTSRGTGASTVPNTPGIHSPRPSPGPISDFRFPTVQSPLSEGPIDLDRPLDDGLMSPTSQHPHSMKMAFRSKESVPTINEHGATPGTRILSAQSLGTGTPRSSGEFYAMSNNSTETLASEYPMQQAPRGHARPPHSRRTSGMTLQQGKMPESLMMGYAQIQGSFTLDGSLINLNPFDQVKRKAVVGGQGGGVIGVETTKRDSGLLRGFGWGNIGSSLGELLGGGELSTIKEMRGIASARPIPLLSTPQSILFVDLQLTPGESRTYEYSFKLPKGLPPSHRGKAVKIVYSLVIGTQRPGGVKEQQVRTVDIPFRVLGSVNSHGEILGHDLMNPYVLLRDLAKIKTVDKPSSTTTAEKNAMRKTSTSTPAGSMDDFLTYVDDLLMRQRQGSGASLLSPTADAHSRRTSTFDQGDATAKEAIDLAIMRANLAAEGAQSPNRFEIARNGQRVGVVMLTRPAYRLGETVTLAIDFMGAEIPCYAVHSALETAERVDPSLALRSEASIHRVTRRTHVAASETTLFARRIIFTPTIPIHATPEFITSGVSLEWKIRLEFVVPSSTEESNGSAAAGGEPPDSDSEEEGGHHDAHGRVGGARRGVGKSNPLLEEISRDEKGGLVLVAVESLACESFEVAVPLRVYGAVGTGLERLDRDDAYEEGLLV